MSQLQEDPTKASYLQFFKYAGPKSLMQKIWAEAFGEQYPEGLDHYGYATQSDLNKIVEGFDLAPGSTLLDIGCGKGGPGMRIAESLKAKLIGVDPIPDAIAQAQEFSQHFELDPPPVFELGEWYGLPFEDQSIDAVTSIDSLWTAPNKIQALMEAKRVMKPGAKFIFTHWDIAAVDPIPLLEYSGLTFVSREDTANWKEYQIRIYEGILRHEEELKKEMGEAAETLLHEARVSPPHLDKSVRRIYTWVRKD